jgi:hypothetical protein
MNPSILAAVFLLVVPDAPSTHQFHADKHYSDPYELPHRLFMTTYDEYRPANHFDTPIGVYKNYDECRNAKSNMDMKYALDGTLDSKSLTCDPCLVQNRKYIKDINLCSTYE